MNSTSDSLTDRELVTLLDFYGHLRAPFGESREVTTPVADLRATDQVVRDAVESYQTFHAAAMEPIIAAFYPQRWSPVVKPDGIVDRVTSQLMRTTRCACPDYFDAALPAERAGVGSWKGCHGVGDFHSAIVKFMGPPPAFLTPYMPQIWQRVVDEFAALGMLLRRDDSSVRPNIEVHFVKPDGNWAGLAQVGNRQTCGEKLWSKFDRDYAPADLVTRWTVLMLHEFGHIMGLMHSVGGVMNAYLQESQKPTWVGDTSRALLVSMFGGVPVPRAPVQRDMVLAWQTGPNTFEVIQKIPTTGGGSFWPS